MDDFAETDWQAKFLQTKVDELERSLRDKSNRSYTLYFPEDLLMRKDHRRDSGGRRGKGSEMRKITVILEGPKPKDFWLEVILTLCGARFVIHPRMLQRSLSGLD